MLCVLPPLWPKGPGGRPDAFSVVSNGRRHAHARLPAYCAKTPALDFDMFTFSLHFSVPIRIMESPPLPAQPVDPPTFQEDQDVAALVAVLQEHLRQLERQYAELMTWGLLSAEEIVS
jgi:hypothetical protein